MCGKFRSLESWQQVHDHLEAWSSVKTTPQSNDREVTYRVMSNLPVIVFDRDSGKRRVLPMRWGYPAPSDYRRPQPIHARSETIETTKAFASSFLDGQRGIVLMRSFNEAPDTEGATVQHVITPGEEPALAAAFVWRRFDIPALPAPTLACCLITVPANSLIATLPTDRMPAFLAEGDWSRWLGEEPATVDELKACLRTVEGVKWTMTKEERAASPMRRKPTVSNPSGLL